MQYYTHSNFIDFCDEVFGDYHLTNSSSNINVVCPFCKSKKGKGYSNRKLVIHTTQQMMHCWVCGYKSKNMLHILKLFNPGRLKSYMENFLDSELLSAEQTKEYTKEVIKLPEQFQLLATADMSRPIIKEAMNYLKARRLDSLSNLWYWRFGIHLGRGKLSRRIIAPSYDGYGNLNYYTARTYMRNTRVRRYENPNISREDIVINELNIDWTKELTVVEGMFDMFKCNSNATAMMGSELNTDYKLFEKIAINKTPVLLAMDNDPTGEYKSQIIAKRLSEYDITVRLPDWTGFDHDDVGTMCSNEFNDFIGSAKIYTKDFSLRRRIQKLI